MICARLDDIKVGRAQALTHGRQRTERFAETDDLHARQPATKMAQQQAITYHQFIEFAQRGEKIFHSHCKNIDTRLKRLDDVRAVIGDDAIAAQQRGQFRQ